MTEREQTTIRLPRELKRELEERAREKGISFNELVMIQLNRYRLRRENVQTVQRV